MDYHRTPMTHAQFLRAVSRFQEIFPGGTRNSGWRSGKHNADVGGAATSKHCEGNPLQPIACDIDYNPEPDKAAQAEMTHSARVLGLWGLYHLGHMHLQGLAPGPVPDWWSPGPEE